MGMTRQVAALPYRFADGTGGPIEVLLVTSFRSKRWIIPKGNVDGDMRPHLAAAKEAEEEGGVRGDIVKKSIGRYRYYKLRESGACCRLEVDVFPLEVREELDDWVEKSIRDRRWLPLEEAAETVGEPDLAAIMRAFRP
jgi:8-oxo-dGTP pyrophosphatase MutT (NUDIX family)